MIIHNCEQGSPEWFSLRAGIPTASEFKKLVTSKGEPSKSMPEYAITLAAEKYAGKPLEAFSGNSWTDRGKELEPDAAETYSFIRGCEVAEVGFVTDDNLLYGCSPDRLVGDKGMIEIKCLKTENHVKLMMYYDNYGKVPSDYIAQAQGQMFVCEREYCDLVFYHPELPVVIAKQTPDVKIVETLQSQLEAVAKERDRVFNFLQAA